VFTDSGNRVFTAKPTARAFVEEPHAFEHVNRKPALPILDRLETRNALKSFASVMSGRERCRRSFPSSSGVITTSTCGAMPFS